jgi:hypothetical protein
MLTYLALSLAVAAQAPLGQPVPRLVEVTVGGGMVTIPVNRVEAVIAGPLVLERNLDGQLVVRGEVRRTVPVDLSEVRDLRVFTVDGKDVALADAKKRLAGGGTVVVAADGRKVEPRHLKLFKDDVLVLVSPELADPPKGVVSAGPLNIIPQPGK